MTSSLCVQTVYNSQTWHVLLLFLFYLIHTGELLKKTNHRLWYWSREKILMHLNHPYRMVHPYPYRKINKSRRLLVITRPFITPTLLLQRDNTRLNFLKKEYCLHVLNVNYIEQQSPTFLASGSVSWKTIFPRTGGMGRGRMV